MRRVTSFWLFHFGLALVAPAAGFSTIYYVSPGGSDSATGLSSQAPFKTFGHSFSVMAPGDELVLLNGDYSSAAGTGVIAPYNSSTCAACGQPPSGTGPGGETIVRAGNPGQATVNGTLSLGTKSAAGKVQYVRIQGIRFEGGGKLYNTAYVTIKECGFHSVANSTGSTFSIGTNDHNYHNEHNLIEDCWIWGRDRIIALNYRSDGNVWRRVVIRGDGCNSTGCTGSGNPNVGLSVYNSSDVSIQNVLVLDRILGGGQPYGDFATAQHAPSSTVDEGAGEYLGPNEWLGCISLNSEDSGFYFEADRAKNNTHRLVNVVSWNNRFGVNIGKIAFSPPATAVLLENVTAGKSWGAGSDNIRVAPETLGGTVRNLIAYNAARYGVNSKIPPSYSNVHGAAQGAYNQTACTAGCQSLDPLTAGPPLPLRYITRIESGSALAGSGYNGGDYGANVVKRYGVDGSRFGDTDYNALTDLDLWPWPNEARIRAHLCQGVTRGFCDPQWSSLTDYVWRQLGNPPPDFTPPSSDCLTASYPDARWQNRSFTAQNGTFTAQVDVEPSAQNADLGVSLSSGAQTSWSALAVTVLFHPDGTIQLRNGGAYTAGLVPYTANTWHHLRLVVDVPSHTYSAYVTPAGGAEQLLGTGMAFRNGQEAVSSLDHWILSADAASIGGCNFDP